MQCAGGRPLQKPGQRPGLSHGCPSSCPRLPFRPPPAIAFHALNGPKPCARRVLLFAAAVPPQPSDHDPVAGVSIGSLSGSDGGSATNGTPPAVAGGNITVGSNSSSSSGASEAAGNGGATIVTVSARSSFRSILRRTYLGELLFMVIGSAICGGLAQWTVGTPLRRFNPYSFNLTLPLATGVVMGTPLRMKGVPMGSVLCTTPLLDRVVVEVEVNEAKTIIPRNATFELTQSGLIPAASIDISPPEGVSADVLAAIVAARAAGATSSSAAGGAGGGSGEVGKDGGSAAAGPASAVRPKRAARVRLASPKDVAACRLQDVLVCHGDHLDGIQGGSMDELMAHMLKTLRQGEVEGNGSVPGRGPIQG